MSNPVWAQFAKTLVDVSASHGMRCTALDCKAIYQEFNLVEELSAAENIFLGNEIRRGVIVDKKAMAVEAGKVFADLHIDIDPNAPVKSLTVGYQQMVEIAKAVAKNSRILIMDEPSAVLTNAEVANLYEMIAKLKARGVTIAYISQDFREIPGEPCHSFLRCFHAE